VTHTCPIDWLELNPSATRLLFRDKRRQLHLYGIARDERHTLLSNCSYCQWAPDSDVVVAQNLNNLCVWYSVYAPDRVTIIQVCRRVDHDGGRMREKAGGEGVEIAGVVRIAVFAKRMHESWSHRHPECLTVTKRSEQPPQFRSTCAAPLSVSLSRLLLRRNSSHCCSLSLPSPPAPLSSLFSSAFQVKGEVLEIERHDGKTEVVVEEGGAGGALSYVLDEILIEFGAALERRRLERCAELLEQLALTPETEAMWEVRRVRPSSSSSSPADGSEWICSGAGDWWIGKQGTCHTPDHPRPSSSFLARCDVRLRRSKPDAAHALPFALLPSFVPSRHACLALLRRMRST